MKHAILSIISLLFLATNLFAAAWTGATSEPENMKKIDGKPFYVITNADELAWFVAKVNAGETAINAIFANDIVLGADTASYTNVAWKGMDKFDGILDGNGFAIYGLRFINCTQFNSAENEKYFISELSKNGIAKNLFLKKIEAIYPGGHSACFIQWGFVKQNNGLIYNVHNFTNQIVPDCNMKENGGIAFINNGEIRRCSNHSSVPQCTGGYAGGIVGLNNGIIDSCQNYNGESTAYDGYFGGIAAINKGQIRYSINHAKSVEHNTSTQTSSGGIAGTNSGEIMYCIQEKWTEYSLAINNTGKIISSIDISTLSYYSNNKKVQLTEESMKSDLTAWKLNTLDGTEENSGVWTRGTDGYPTFANEDSLAIRKVVFDDDGTTSNRYTNYKGLVTFPEDPEPAEGYIFSGWYNANDTKVKPTTVFTADQTVKAVYTDASDVYWTINFYNAAPADTVLESKSYQHGSIVTYGGEAPTLASTAQYTYTFKGWNVEPTNAVEDFDYHAVYDSTIRSYAVTFINTDSSKIESASFEYGKMPNCTKTPTREATVEWKYSHKGWKPALDFVTEDASYLAIYDSVKVKYKVTFMNGTSVIDTQSVAYGEAAVAPTNVNREGYKFVGWNTSFAKVTEALTVKALFEELIIRTVNVVDVDGEKIDNVKIEDGETYTLPEAPKKESYTFDAYYDGNKKLGVAGDKISVTANITITAKYIENPKSSSSQQEIASSSSTSRNDEVSSNSRSDKSSSSSAAKSSSSSKKKSSSSTKTDAIVASVVPQFSVMVNGRSLQISAARIGATYALFDMQGKVLLQGRVQSANFEIPVACSGNYLIRVGNNVQRIAVK